MREPSASSPPKIIKNGEMQMSLVDKFDDAAEPAFIPQVYREGARRQLRASLILVFAMAVAAFVLDYALPIGASSTTRGELVASNDSAFSGRLISTTE
jgi:hypothetical protein